jgi:hypothetical protein
VGPEASHIIPVKGNPPGHVFPRFSAGKANNKRSRKHPLKFYLFMIALPVVLLYNGQKFVTTDHFYEALLIIDHLG